MKFVNKTIIFIKNLILKFKFLKFGDGYIELPIFVSIAIFSFLFGFLPQVIFNYAFDTLVLGVWNVDSTLSWSIFGFFLFNVLSYIILSMGYRFLPGDIIAYRGDLGVLVGGYSSPNRVYHIRHFGVNGSYYVCNVLVSQENGVFIQEDIPLLTKSDYMFEKVDKQHLKDLGIENNGLRRSDIEMMEAFEELIDEKENNKQKKNKFRLVSKEDNEES